jgi:hypothetical protein
MLRLLPQLCERVGQFNPHSVVSICILLILRLALPRLYYMQP